MFPAYRPPYWCSPKVLRSEEKGERDQSRGTEASADL